MKKLLLAIALVMSGCAPVQPPTCTITWTCTSSSCAYQEGAWSGTGSFGGANYEEDCLAWGTAFRYAGGRTSSCNCSN